MRLYAVAAVVTAMLVLPAASASAAPKTRFCGAHTYTYKTKSKAKRTVLLNVFASKGVMCSFARRHARASYQRRRCAKGWRYKRVSPNSFCTRKGRIYFAIRVKT